MSSSPLIDHARRGGLAVLSLQAPPRNVLTQALLTALLTELEQARKAGTRAVLLCSNLADFSDGDQTAQVKRELSGQDRGAGEVLGLLTQFDEFPLPIVAAVRGKCVGGGYELALACDYVVVSTTAHLRRIEGDASLDHAVAELHRLAQEIEVLRDHTPQELEQLGLVNLVVADERVEDTAMSIAQQLAAGPTLAHIATKKLASIAMHQGIKAADAAMVELQKPLWTSEDLKIGLAALKATGMPGTAAYQGR